MYQRQIELELKHLAKQYRVITVTGPRQSGKTTLVCKAFPDKAYVNLEIPDVRKLATHDPRAFLGRYPEGAILDEIQRVPELLSYIQGIVDFNPTPGMFILTGSHQMRLHEAIFQSLAGRTALLSLLPLSLSELQQAGIELTLEEAIYTGGFPGIFESQLVPTKAYRYYLQTYLERDVRELIQLHDLIQFQNFLGLCAGRIGQLLNYQNLANDVGVSSHTIKHWLGVLEASYIIVRLRPYFENFGKRIVKSPKLYFTDVGFACYLLGIEKAEQVARDPLRGGLFENFVLLELMKARFNQGHDPHLYYYRDTSGREVDLIFQSGRDLMPIEVKSAQTYNARFTENLKFFQKLVKERCFKGTVIYAGIQEQKIGPFELVNYRQAAKIMGVEA